jgi:leucyl aminopeptidase
VLYLVSPDLKAAKIETLIIPVCEDRHMHDDSALTSLIKTAKKLKEFKGGKGDEVIIYHPSEVKAVRVVFMGLGKFEKLDLEVFRSVAGKAAKKCIKKNLSEVLIAVPFDKEMKPGRPDVLVAMQEGAFLGNHLFVKYKNEKKNRPLKKIGFLVKPEEIEKYSDLSSRVEKVCQGTILARDWVSTPSNDKQPEAFANEIVRYAAKEQLKARVMDEKELRKKNFGAILAVAAGSLCKPRMVVLDYDPKRYAKTIALVGKGVTFDSGGINLKPTASLEGMKEDMAGAAAVAATMITIAKLKPEIRVIGVIPIVENMPSGGAFRPGDIIRSFKGTTVEIGNMDAEGRLILIDAMSYVIKEYNPQILIDVATLTGACVVALGEKIAAVFSYDQKLADNIIRAGRKTHERCWQMPLPDDYKELLKSDFADINNKSSSRWGGAITAALFLSEFAGDTRWAHIDIAGPAYVKKETAYCGVGGTGFGVRLLCDLLETL